MNQFFEVTDIPEHLGPRPRISPDLITHEQVLTIKEHNLQAIIPVAGDCLEGAQVMDGGWVCVDFTHFPAPPRRESEGGDGGFDLCLCWTVFPGQARPAVMCKRYGGVWGSWQMVTTCYDLSKGVHPYNCGMRALEIFGVIIASWTPGGRLLWKRDPEGFPAKLGTVPTLHGGNIGNPVSLGTGQAVKAGIRLKERFQNV